MNGPVNFMIYSMSLSVCETHKIMPRLFQDTFYDTMVCTEISLHAEFMLYVMIVLVRTTPDTMAQ